MKKFSGIILLIVFLSIAFGFADVLKRYPNGKVKIEGSVINGKIDGQVKKYSETGKILETAEYQANVLNGERRKYHPNGSIAVIEKYVQGKIDGEAWTYYDTGEKELVLNYKQGKLLHYTAFTRDGKIDLNIDYTK